MATVTKPMALDESIHTTDGNDTNIADLMQSGLAAIATAVGNIPTPTASNVSWSGTINGTAVTNVAGALTALNDGLATNTTLLGTTDISSIDDGTVTGAIDAINTDLTYKLVKLSFSGNSNSYGFIDVTIPAGATILSVWSDDAWVCRYSKDESGNPIVIHITICDYLGNVLTSTASAGYVVYAVAR